MTNLTENEKKILVELRKNVESDSDVTIGFGIVYLPNCESSNTKNFSGTLASLQKKNYYKSYQEEYREFGEVLLEDK